MGELTFGLLTATIETPEMTKKLKAAEPTMVEGPNLPGCWPRVETVSIILSII